MPDIDLEPGNYRERKPKGWRWKLPWSHDDDNKLPLVVFCGLAGLFFYMLTRTDSAEQAWVVIGTAAVTFPAGVLLALWLRD